MSSDEAGSRWSDRVTSWATPALVAALALAVVDMTLLLVNTPPAFGGLTAPIFLASLGAFAPVSFGLALFFALFQPLLVRLPRPRPEVLLAGVLGIVLAAGLLRGLHRLFDSLATEFPAVEETVTDVASLLLAAGAFTLARLGLPACRWLLRKAPSLAVRDRLLRLVALVAVFLFGGVLPQQFHSIHAVLTFPSGLLALVLLLALVRAQVFASSRRAGVASLVLLAASFGGALGALQQREVAYLFHSATPIADGFARLWSPVADADGDGALSPLFGGDDCAPFDGERGPERREQPADGVDQDCRGGDANEVPIERASVSGSLWQGCAEPPAKRWSVLLLTVDALRASALEPRRVPAIARLAGQSAWFTRAYAPATNTIPTFAAMFSGKAVNDVIGQNVDNVVPLSAPEDTLPVLFERAGYRTGSAFTFAGPDHLKLGFQERGPLENDFRADDKESFHSSDVTRAAADFLGATDAEQPFFFWAHYPDAHAPYVALPQFSTDGSDRERYLAEVRYVDHHIGRLLEVLGESEHQGTTIVVLTADHGEDLGERGKEGHGPDVYERSIHVPLALFVPGCPSVLVEQPVSGIDLYATLAALTGAEVASPTLYDAVAGKARPLPVVSETRFQDIVRRAVVSERYKLLVDVRSGGRLLFDLENDPEETTSLYGEAPMTDEMEALYQRWLDRP